jgi:putative sigma-54 modulation protein
MDTSKIKVSFIGMESSNALRDYALEKFTKHENLLTSLTTGEIILSSEVAARGIDSDFRVDVNYSMSGRKIHVEEVGEDMYKLIDTASDKLFRRMKRFADKKRQWEGEIPWKIIEAAEEIDSNDPDVEGELDDYSDYIPQIGVRKRIQDMSPIEEAEAIELMELSGYSQYLFRNKRNDKICMVYRRQRGGYGLVEPAEGL